LRGTEEIESHFRRVERRCETVMRTAAAERATPRGSDECCRHTSTKAAQMTPKLVHERNVRLPVTLFLLIIMEQILPLEAWPLEERRAEKILVRC
jgi:hypothetical protein